MSELRDIIEDGLDKALRNKRDKGNIIILNKDFELKFDTFAGLYRLNWIWNESGKYKGTDILKTVLEVVSDRLGDKPVTTTGIRGEFKGIQTNGAYTMLRWGFLPEGGVEMLNSYLGEDYVSLEAAFKDPVFWENWKKYASEYDGVFDMTPGSLSWDLLLKKI